MNKILSPSQSDFRQIVKTQLVEVLVAQTSSTLGQFKFPTQDFLRGKYITSIETFDVTDMPVAPQSGFALITAANLLNSFLTLYEQNPEAIDAQGVESSGEGQWNELIPLVRLHNVQNATPDPFVRHAAILTPRVVVWEKSYVQLANGTVLGNSGGPVAFVFQVGYIGNARDKN